MIALLLALAASAADLPGYDKLLAADVSGGRVDYADLRTHRAELDAVVAAIGAASGPQDHGFWLNAYNALVLHDLASLPSLPAKVTDLPGFFDATKHRVAGEELTLNDLEGRIRAWGDPRVHFALNCGARSCPPLQAQPFPADPGARLEAATAAFLDGSGVVIDDARHQIQLSRIFDWYRADFGGDPVAFALAHLSDPAKRARLQAAKEAGYAVSYQEYDWTPNAR